MNRRTECLKWAAEEYIQRMEEDYGRTIQVGQGVSIETIEQLNKALSQEVYLVVNNEILMNGSHPMILTQEEAIETKKQLLKKDMLLKVDLINPQS